MDAHRRPRRHRQEHRHRVQHPAAVGRSARSATSIGYGVGYEICAFSGDGTIKGLQNSAKVATARKLRDEVTAYQREVARLRAQLEERTAEAEGATPIPLLSAVLLAERSGVDCADQLRA